MWNRTARRTGNSPGLSLTHTGKRLVAKIARWNDVFIDFVTADVVADEREAFYAALGKIVATAREVEVTTRRR